MSFQITFLLAVLVLVNAVLCVPGLKGACATKSYSFVQDFDLKRYLGTWYEITHSESFYFGRDCLCTTADYTLRSDGKVKVSNGCRKNSVFAEIFSQDGRARQVTKGTGDLRVSFVPFEVPLIGFLFEANYRIVALDKDYQWAAILSCSRLPRVGGSNAWILSRTPTINPETKAFIRSQLEAQGIDLSDQVDTSQEGCWNLDGSPVSEEQGDQQQQQQQQENQQSQYEQSRYQQA